MVRFAFSQAAGCAAPHTAKEHRIAPPPPQPGPAPEYCRAAFWAERRCCRGSHAKVLLQRHSFGTAAPLTTHSAHRDLPQIAETAGTRSNQAASSPAIAITPSARG